MNKTTVARTVSAVRFIRQSFQRVQMGHTASIGLRFHSDAAEAVRQWASPAREYLGDIEGRSVGMREMMLRQPVMAVALVTYRYQDEKAMEFWRDVAGGTGLEKGQAQYETREVLLRPHFARKEDPAFVSRLVSAGWNAFFEKRSIALLKVLDRAAPINILGTPYAGK